MYIIVINHGGRVAEWLGCRTWDLGDPGPSPALTTHWFNFLAALENSQRICLLPVGIRNSVALIIDLHNLFHYPWNAPQGEGHFIYLFNAHITLPVLPLVTVCFVQVLEDENTLFVLGLVLLRGEGGGIDSNLTLISIISLWTPHVSCGISWENLFSPQGIPSVIICFILKQCSSYSRMKKWGGQKNLNYYIFLITDLPCWHVN